VEFPVVKSSHIVPRTYLRGFADDENRIAVRIRGDAEPHIVNVRNAGTRSKFYVRERLDGTEIHDIEWSLSHIEDAAGPVLRRLPNDWPLSLSDKTTLAELFALQLLRGPRWIEWHEAFTRDFIEEQRAKGISASELAALQEHLLSKTDTFVRMIDLSRKVLSVIASLKWTLLKFAGPWLATSDHPVVVWPLGVSARRAQSTPHGGGLFETLEYRVPISPRSSILMTWADEPDASAVAYKHDAASLNAFTMGEASPQWFHLPGVSPPVAAGSLTPPHAASPPGTRMRPLESQNDALALKRSCRRGSAKST
jgi:hypothetical protein